MFKKKKSEKGRKPIKRKKGNKVKKLASDKKCNICKLYFSEEKIEYHKSKCLDELEKEEDDLLDLPCGICDKKKINNVFILDECSHRFCSLCLQEYVRTSMATDIEINCPFPECEAGLSMRDVKLFLPSKEERKSIVKTTGSVQGIQRIANELTNILSSDSNDNGYSVEPIDDNLYHWEVRFFGFEESGVFAEDMARMGIDFITFHVTFPKTYPFAPPYIRVIRPRFKYLTGHVTIGGSVCIELLTNKGWSPENTVEAILISVRLQLLLGGARLDFNNTRDYTEHEAKEAFDRLVRVHGWQ